MCFWRLKAKWFFCTLINVQASAATNENREEVKEELYNLLEQSINQIANSEIKIIF
jgi:hypothetical protein